MASVLVWSSAQFDLSSDAHDNAPKTPKTHRYPDWWLDCTCIGGSGVSCPLCVTFTCRDDGCCDY